MFSFIHSPRYNRMHLILSSTTNWHLSPALFNINVGLRHWPYFLTLITFHCLVMPFYKHGDGQWCRKIRPKNHTIWYDWQLLNIDGLVVQMDGHQIRDQKVTRLTWVGVYTLMPLPQTGIIWYRSTGGDAVQWGTYIGLALQQPRITVWSGAKQPTYGLKA